MACVITQTPTNKGTILDLLKRIDKSDICGYNNNVGVTDDG